MAYKKSDWFKGLLDAEQHIYEGYSTEKLRDVIDQKLCNKEVSPQAHLGVYDYFWYNAIILRELK